MSTSLLRVPETLQQYNKAFSRIPRLGLEIRDLSPHDPVYTFALQLKACVQSLKRFCVCPKDTKRFEDFQAELQKTRQESQNVKPSTQQQFTTVLFNFQSVLVSLTRECAESHSIALVGTLERTSTVLQSLLCLLD